jgi:membrane protein DedA with SNARE-associated domain
MLMIDWRQVLWLGSCFVLGLVVGQKIGYYRGRRALGRSLRRAGSLINPSDL